MEQYFFRLGCGKMLRQLLAGQQMHRQHQHQPDEGGKCRGVQHRLQYGAQDKRSPQPHTQGGQGDTHLTNEQKCLEILPDHTGAPAGERPQFLQRMKPSGPGPANGCFGRCKEGIHQHKKQCQQQAYARRQRNGFQQPSCP
ncbi:hypothetical protein D3C75_787120 [compost metagenome]